MRELLSRIIDKIDREAGVHLERTLVYQQLSHSARTMVRPCNGVFIQSISPSEFPLLAKVDETGSADSEERIRRHDECYAAYLDGQIAHYSWVQHTGNHHIVPAGTKYSVMPGSLWIYDCHTAPWARGRGLYPSTLCRIVQDYFLQGFSTALIYTSPSNVASQRGILRSGFQLCCTLSAIRVGHRYYARPQKLGLQRTCGDDLRRATAL